MGSPYAMFKTDKVAEAEQGVVLDYGDFRIRIARAGGANKKFTRLISTKLKPFRRQMETDTLSEDVATKLMIEAYADGIVLGWVSKDKDGNFVDGIHDSEMNIKPYSREAVMKIFADLPDLFKDVQAQANQAALFRAVDLETDAKNSSAV